jgi:transcriptional regulator with XRE-family HTH domain
MAPTNFTTIEGRVAHRLSVLRAERGWSLEQLARQTGISRATLSRLERCELSPTASMLCRLCTVYGWTLSRLMADAESNAPQLIRALEQESWTDPETGYQRRILSPPGPGLHGELVEIRLPQGACASFDNSPVPGLEHHLWMLEGGIEVVVSGKRLRLNPGDCLRYVLDGPSRYECKGRRDARYVLALVRP